MIGIFHRDIFEKLIHLNEDLIEVEKFHYLRSFLYCYRDTAVDIMKSIKIATNCHEVWAVVKECFDSQR